MRVEFNIFVAINICLMNRFSILIICLLVSFSAFAQKVANEIILRTSSNTSTKTEMLRSIKSMDRDINYVELKPLCKSLDIYLLIIETTSGSDFSKKAINKLQFNKDVDYAYANSMTHRRATPNDPRVPNQWNLGLVRAIEAWDVTTGGEDFNGNEIVIAVMDDGFDIDHEDIQSNLWMNNNEIIGDGIDNDFNGYIDDKHGIDLDSEDGNIDLESHGTSVMGIIGADSNNEIGISGINWNSKVMVLSSVTNEAKVIAGYDYIYQMRNMYNLSSGITGAYVVATNYSLGIDDEFGVDHPAWCNLYDLLGDVGIVSVGATTNSNSNVDEQGDLPTTCSSPYFIGVTNTDKDDLKVTNAGFGQEHIDLSAPGRNTETFKPDSQYGTFGGTSASAPHVTGALGLLYSIKCENLAEFIKERPGEAALRIRQSILNGTDALPSLNGVTASGGRLNILKSMSDLSEFCSNDPTIPISGDLQVDFVREDKNGTYTIFYKSPDTREVTLTIYDMIGRKLYTTQSIPSVFSRSNERINLVRYQAGVYIATLTLEDEVVSYKFRHISQ